MNEEKDTGQSPEKLKWHPAFLEAIQQELSVEYRDILEFKYEYQMDHAVSPIFLPPFP